MNAIDAAATEQRRARKIDLRAAVAAGDLTQAQFNRYDAELVACRKATASPTATVAAESEAASVTYRRQVSPVPADASNLC